MAATQPAPKPTRMTAPRFEYVLGADADTQGGAVKLTRIRVLASEPGRGGFSPASTAPA